MPTSSTRSAATAPTQAVVRSLIELGHELELTVVAEGVESREVWDGLAEASAATTRKASTSQHRRRRTR